MIRVVRIFLSVICATLLIFTNLVLANPAEEALLHTTANPQIKQGYVNTEDGQVHYWEAGNGPAILFIHQSSSSVEEYAGMVPFLADKYRLITFDWPGHGSSDDPNTEYGVDDFTRSAMAVIDSLEVEKFHLLGNHGGALIAMNIDWKHAQRVDQLILAGTSGVKEQKEAEEFTESLDLERRNLLDREGKSLSEAWARYLDYMPNSAPEEILRPFLNNVVTRVRPYDAHYGVLRWDRRPALASFKDRELLLMQGESDPFVSHQETLLKILPKAKRAVVENSGVFMFFEKPEASAKVIAEFLARYDS